ncbi:MAG: hypothetical protein ACOZAO_04080 [Patescibacteria group bacterium]
MFKTLARALKIFNEAKSLQRNKASVVDISQALRHQDFLGLGHLSEEEYEAVLVRASCLFWKPVNLCHQLSWPEFIIIVAWSMKHRTTRTDFDEKTMLILRAVGTVGGMTRQGMSHYFSFKGWQPIQ